MSSPSSVMKNKPSMKHAASKVTDVIAIYATMMYTPGHPRRQ
jgi:hypothetical protein